MCPPILSIQGLFSSRIIDRKKFMLLIKMAYTITLKTPVTAISYNANYFKIKFLPVQNVVLSFATKGYSTK